MSKHFAILTATSALALIATPALAQQLPVDDRYAGVGDVVDVATGWEGEAQAGASYTDAGSAVVQEYYSDPVIADIEAYEPDYDYDYEYVEDADYAGEYPVRTHRAHRSIRPHHQQAAAPRFAYTAAQREEWLAQCRALHRQDNLVYYEEDEGADGGLIGSLLGAVAGGVIGNRVADGERLAGTLIGAGLGGLAGLVIGTALDGDDDEGRYVEQDYGFDYCEAYLLNYERGYGTPGQVTYAPVAMVPVAQPQVAHQPHRRMISRVIEHDVVVEEVHEPTPRRVIRRAAPARQPGKVQPLR